MWPNHFLSHAPFIWHSTISRRRFREVLSPGLRRQYFSLPISSLPIPLTSVHKESFRNLISTSYTLPRSFYFMTQFPLPYTHLRVAIILHIFLFSFPVLYRVMQKSPYKVLLLFQGNHEPPCILTFWHPSFTFKF